LIIVGVLIVLFLIIKERNRRAKEKAEETERILNTPVERMGNEGDDLIKKYSGETATDTAQGSSDTAQSSSDSTQSGSDDSGQE